jgi:hypothetical protein
MESLTEATQKKYDHSSGQDRLLFTYWGNVRDRSNGE